MDAALRVRDGNAVSVLWSFMFVFEIQYTGVLWRLLLQNERTIVVRELINGVTTRKHSFSKEI